jgi:pSer/pThr/pTyr-binding forkhead associated (FHA) protein
MSKIRILNGPYRGREKTLATKALTIGRDAEAGIQIIDRSASRFHAEVFPVGGMYFVRDLDSKNGSLVNDEKITDEELLREGDIIKIGSTELIFEAGSALSDEDSLTQLSFRDDFDALSKTMEFRLDELSDISDPQDSQPEGDSARSLRLLYQIGRLLSDGDAAHLAERETKVMEFLVQSMPAECAVVFRREGATGKLVPSSVRTATPASQPVISRSIVKKTFAENKALHITDAQDDERVGRSASVLQKGVRSVVCVPLTVGGQVRGVVYLGRGADDTPFEPLHLELLSAVAIQLGMCYQALDQQNRHRLALAKTVGAMTRALEAREGLSGTGERCARFCLAMAGAMKLDAGSKEEFYARTRLFLFQFLPGNCDARIERKLRALQLLRQLTLVGKGCFIFGREDFIGKSFQRVMGHG